MSTGHFPERAVDLALGGAASASRSRDFNRPSGAVEQPCRFTQTTRHGRTHKNNSSRRRTRNGPRFHPLAMSSSEGSHAIARRRRRRSPKYQSRSRRSTHRSGGCGRRASRTTKLIGRIAAHDHPKRGRGVVEQSTRRSHCRVRTCRQRVVAFRGLSSQTLGSGGHWQTASPRVGSRGARGTRAAPYARDHSRRDASALRPEMPQTRLTDS